MENLKGYLRGSLVPVPEMTLAAIIVALVLAISTLNSKVQAVYQDPATAEMIRRSSMIP